MSRSAREKAGHGVLDTGIEISQERQGETLIISVGGELDMMTGPSLKAVLARITDADHVVVDCTDVEFMDSSGLYVFLVEARRLARLGGSLHLRNASIPVRHLLEIAGFESLLEPGPR